MRRGPSEADQLAPGTEILPVQPRGEPVVSRNEKPGAPDRLALGRRKGFSEEALLRRRVLRRVAFGEPEPLTAGTSMSRSETSSVALRALSRPRPVGWIAIRRRNGSVSRTYSR